MTIHHFPKQLDPFKAADQQFQWQGCVPLTRFSRLSQLAIADTTSSIMIDCRLTIDAFHRFIWLDAQLSGQIELECQRCLDVLHFEIDSDTHLAILNDERMIEHLQEETDFVILGENDSSQKGDYLNHAQVDLLALLEDEILLDIPVSPKHEDCQHRYQPATEPDVPEEKENPFGILAALKKPN